MLSLSIFLDFDRSQKMFLPGFMLQMSHKVTRFDEFYGGREPEQATTCNKSEIVKSLTESPRIQLMIGLNRIVN